MLHADQVKEMLIKPLMPHHHLRCICKKKKKKERKYLKHILSKKLDGKSSGGALKKQKMKSNFSVTKN